MKIAAVGHQSWKLKSKCKKQKKYRVKIKNWIPAFAGMTNQRAFLLSGYRNLVLSF